MEAESTNTTPPTTQGPSCEAKTPLCSNELVREYSVNGSAAEGKTFHLCGACRVYLRRGGSEITEVT
jgi:hypothetical protein